MTLSTLKMNPRLPCGHDKRDYLHEYVLVSGDLSDLVYAEMLKKKSSIVVPSVFFYFLLHGC